MTLLPVLRPTDTAPWGRRGRGLRTGAGLLGAAALFATAACSDSSSSGGDDAAADLVAVEDQQGSFNTRCEYSHTAHDDPIVHAGHAGMSHLHEFFGATTTDADATVDSLLAGDTTCQTRADRSAYWAPAVLVDGEPVHPTHVVVYYRVPLGADAAEVEVPPNGLEMIAGDHHAAAPQDPDEVHWACGPRGEPEPEPPPCWVGVEPVLRLHFDPCWDGENLASADHRSHLAKLGADGSCPDSHPVLLPQLRLEFRYPVDGAFAEGELSLASGSLTSGHGDALLAWDEQAMANEVETCLVTNRSCDVVLERSRITVSGGT